MKAPGLFAGPRSFPKLTTKESPDTASPPDPTPAPESAAHHPQSVPDPAVESESAAPPATLPPQSLAAASTPPAPGRRRPPPDPHSNARAYAGSDAPGRRKNALPG